MNDQRLDTAYHEGPDLNLRGPSARAAGDMTGAGSGRSSSSTKGKYPFEGGTDAGVG